MTFTKRALLGGALAAPMLGMQGMRKARAGEGGWTRKGFLWGTAGAGYQVEGGNTASDIWVLEHVKPSIFSEPSGDADDTYNRVGEDIALASSLGFNSHRLSIEWSRIEPEPGQISKAGLAYYRGVLETCHEHGLTPAVTFVHYSVPRWFASEGGFSSPDGVAPFVAHCRRVTEAMGDLFGIAATFNEPNVGTLVRWGGMLERFRPVIDATQKAAGLATGSSSIWSSPMLEASRQQAVIVEAHARAAEAIHAVTGGRVPVGLTLAVNGDRAEGADSGLDRKNAEVLDGWLAAPGDFVGIQSYTGVRVCPSQDLPPEPGDEVTQMGYPYTPGALETAIRLVASRTKMPVYVTENGVATEDDTRRIDYIRGAVAGLQNCLADKIDIRGYFHWSLLDNWEWLSGYRPKFGLVAVDRETFKRIPKPSAHFMGAIARAGGLK